MESIIKWQTGIPTKKGRYILSLKGSKKIDTDNWSIYTKKWYHYNNNYVIAWCKLSDIEPYKEENMDEREEKAVNHVFDVEVISFDIAQKDKYELNLQGKFEVVLREGKYYVERIKPKYPKTYEECCDVLGLSTMDNDAKGYKVDLIIRFQELLIARDAYWKIAGDWKPNWEDETDIYYTISYDGVNIKCYNNTDVYSKLAFPTEEMRDAFYENFKELIETCKELL